MEYPSFTIVLAISKLLMMVITPKHVGALSMLILIYSSHSAVTVAGNDKHE
jgi:hypothetical protein